MNKSEIVRQAKHYFGKDRTFIKDLVLSYEFTGKAYKNWVKEFRNIIHNPLEIKFGIFDDVVCWIKDNEVEEIDWNWIGDLSWTISILLTENVKKGYDWDKNLALKCNGTARFLEVFISDVIPCYTYDCYYMTYNKKADFYEFGPILNLTTTEKSVLEKVVKLLENKGFYYVEKIFCEKEFKNLYSDTNKEGNATLFDVLFSDTRFYTTEIKRFCDKDIIEKDGSKFRWTEHYNEDNTLKNRIESRWTKGGDYFKLVLDSQYQITNVEVMRNEIEGQKYKYFELDILKTFQKRKASTKHKENKV